MFLYHKAGWNEWSLKKEQCSSQRETLRLLNLSANKGDSLSAKHSDDPYSLPEPVTRGIADVAVGKRIVYFRKTISAETHKFNDRPRAIQTAILPLSMHGLNGWFGIPSSSEANSCRSFRPS